MKISNFFSGHQQKYLTISFEEIKEDRAIAYKYLVPPLGRHRESSLEGVAIHKTLKNNGLRRFARNDGGVEASPLYCGELFVGYHPAQ